jgi:hypothetical protein
MSSIVGFPPRYGTQGALIIETYIGRIVDDVESDWRNRTLIDFLQHQNLII